MLKEDLSKKNVDFEYVNILESMGTLKEFLRFRDNNNKIFGEYKSENKLGIPLVVVETDNDTMLFTEKYNANFLNQL